MASAYPDTPRPMQLCVAMVTGMPVYEETGVETKMAIVRQVYTQCLHDLVGEIYMGCYSIGEPFRITYMKLLDLQTNLVLKDQHTIDRLRKYFKNLEPLSLCVWLDEILDSHEGQKEIEFKWMNS